MSFIRQILSLCIFVCIPLSAEIPESSLKRAIPLKWIYHPVSTKNQEAQYSFDKGLTNIFAFNHDLAFREFANAAKLDPNLAMAYWGMALALGQNINQDVTPDHEKKAYAFSRKALELSKGASDAEKAYINALATRYTNDPNADLIPLRFKYKEAMQKVSERYPQDLDAATLYAESILDLSPWRYWSYDGKPLENTLNVISVLDSVLRRNPDHIGANHYLIHAWEASPTPERALMAAFRLTSLSSTGHLLHMPCHIFLLTGFYEEAINTSMKAIGADYQYINEHGLSGNYPLHYLSHNYKVLVRSYNLAENYDNALRVALELVTFIEPHLQDTPDLEKFLISPLEVYLYFHRWDDLLKFNLYQAKSPFVKAYWRYARADAYANLGNIEAARREASLAQKEKMNIKDEEIANNPAIDILNVAEIILEASIAKAQNNQALRIEKLNQAAVAQDKLNYDEPPPWYVSARIPLGKALLDEKRYVEAEIEFQKGLQEFQRNGRTLFGIALSLKGQNRPWDLFWIEREMSAALKHASYKLKPSDL